MVASAGLATAGTFTYSDFSDTSALTLNGNAAQVGNVLRVAPNLASQAGTAYLTAPIAFDVFTAFSTSFEFLITTDTGNPTDGFSFILQNQDVNAVGGQGQGNGFVGISPSVAVDFRGRGPAYTAVIAGGVDPLPLPGTDVAPAGGAGHTEGDFYNQVEFAWIDYDPNTMLLSLFLSPTSSKPGTADLTTTVDVFGNLGSQAFVGFTAGTGGGFGDNDILNWSFTSTQVPEPGTAGVYALGMMGLGLLRRFRRR
jgi:hypothetical protein